VAALAACVDTRNQERQAMISYSDWVAELYQNVRQGGVIRDYHGQIIIRDADVFEQMALHNKTAFFDAVQSALDDTITSPFARQKIIDLFRDAFYQLAAMNESKLRKLYEGKSEWKHQ